MLRFYNTLTKSKQDFIPLEEGRVKMYACGPTVYNFIHIGNARPMTIFDTLRRYLEYRGYEVSFVQNFTDIDDKIIGKANEEGTTYDVIARRYMAEYEIDARGLGVRPASIHPKATETMDEIIGIVQTLIDKGFAYGKDGDVYFRSRRFEGYGKLSHQPLDDLEAGSRVDVAGAKEDALDFVVWKAAKPGEPSWDSPWGKGRPGWHIECSAMVKKHLGNTIDIHGGGQDLIFPHHENEIAQSECANGVEYVRYWLHNGYIDVDGRKMSKSLGNFFTVREVAEKFGYEPIKFFLLQAQYRSPVNYSYEVLEQCKSALERLRTCRDNLDYALKNADDAAAEGSEEFLKGLEARRRQFITAMDDDLNTADGIAALFELAKDCNIYFTGNRAKSDVNAAISMFDELCGVLGLLYDRNGGENDIDAEIQALIDERQQARKNRDFARADEIRDILKARNIVLEDTPNGIKYHIVK
ncbi:cysteine--tRNA ligase [Clostridia bacterium]|nr:cysteine--tRNA ligase [Clostridia bacterium]